MKTFYELEIKAHEEVQPTVAEIREAVHNVIREKVAKSRDSRRASTVTVTTNLAKTIAR